ncbi:MAG: T9SS type A sorting domain-containing protein [Ignavibacteriaceae bacterium]|nr:T9SS type A sorting domain-containing protein [Ignavibacteriaceae bacterium]
MRTIYFVLLCSLSFIHAQQFFGLNSISSAGNTTYFSGDGKLWKKTDSGLQEVTSGGTTIQWRLLAATENLLINAGYNGEYQISTNGGQNWNVSIPEPGVRYTSISYVDTSAIYLSSVTHQKVVKTNLSGTVRNSFMLNSFNFYPYSVYFKNADSGWVCGDYQPGGLNEGRILRTVDGGMNWQVQYTTANNSNQINIMQLKGSFGMALGENDIVITTTDGGASWIRISPEGPSSRDWTALCILDSSLVVAGTEEGNIFYSIDFGESWIQKATNRNFLYIEAIDMLPNGSIGIIGSVSGSSINEAFLEISRDAITEIHESSGNLPIEFSLSQNYPNPFNPVTEIEFALPEQSDITLKVYDILGKEIATLASGSYSAGRYTVPFDGSNHASGVYIYKLSYGKGQSITRKMTMLK